MNVFGKSKVFKEIQSKVTNENTVVNAMFSIFPRIPTIHRVHTFYWEMSKKVHRSSEKGFLLLPFERCWRI